MDVAHNNIFSRGGGTGQVGALKTQPIFPPTLIFRKCDLICFQVLLQNDVCLKRTSTHMLKPTREHEIKSIQVVYLADALLILFAEKNGPAN